MTLSIMPLSHYAECRCAECRDFFIVMLNAIILSVVMLNIVMLIAIVLIVNMVNVIVLSVAN